MSDEPDDMVSSARGMTPNPTDRSSGSWALSDLRLSEAAAREILSERFQSYGVRIHSDFSLHEGSVLCTLDGYDPELRVGYVFLSHADQDVITDVDTETEAALEQLREQGRCFVLVVHDSEVRSREELAARADAFLGDLPPAGERC